MSFLTIIVQEREEAYHPQSYLKGSRVLSTFHYLGTGSSTAAIIAHYRVLRRTPYGTAGNVTCTYVTRDMTLNVSWCTSSTFDTTPSHIHSLNWSFIFTKYITQSDNWSLSLFSHRHTHTLSLSLTLSSQTHSLGAHSQTHSLS